MERPRKLERFLLPLAGLWLLAVAAGMLLVLRYKATPGAAATTSSRWPAASTLGRDPKRPTLVLAVHPRCVCTRATLAELARLVSKSGGALATTVLFLHPEGTSEDWEKGDLWQRVGEIPGARRVVDVGGREASLFGAKTSGQALLYDTHGRLLYAGGLTSARGHEGSSVGVTRILELVRGETPDGRWSPVFGCSLGLSTKPARS